ncbi:MAG: tetratricopeptide repeat protein [Planctomycetaceae bacterium]
MSSQQPAEGPVQLAKSMLQQRKVAEAIQLLNGHLKDNPHDKNGHELLGMACFMIKDYEKAKTAFETLTRDDPMYAPGWVNLGAVQNILGDYQGATRSLQKAIKRDKNSASAYYNLGIAQKAMKMNSMAISAYREASRLAPTMPEPYTNLGNIYIEMQNLTQAIRVMDEGLKHCPGNPKIAAILDKAKNIKAGNRQKEAPLGRLVDEEALARKQINTSRRDLTPAARNEERDSLRTISKTLREATKAMVPLLDVALNQQLHLLQMATVQKDTRGDAAGAYEQMTTTLQQLDGYRRVSIRSIGEIRANLDRTDPGL